MRFRVAAVSFLNTIPLIDSIPADAAVVTRALPSRLSDLLMRGEADVALVPVVELFRGRAAALVPGTGIACRSAVDSVKLFHHGDPASLTRVRADRGSRTSVVLLDVLLREKYGRQVEFVEFEPQPGDLPAPGEGVLVIGDRCFAYEARLREMAAVGVAGLDLGRAWWDLTGLPFVFAMWGVSATFLATATPARQAALVALLNRARAAGEADLDRLAAREAAQGRLGHKGEATTAAVAYYFQKSLRFGLGNAEMAGLARFQELAGRYGLVPAEPAPRLLPS